MRPVRRFLETLEHYLKSGAGSHFRLSKGATSVKSGMRFRNSTAGSQPNEHS